MAKMVSVASYNTSGVGGGRKPLGKASPLANSFSLIDYDKDHRFLIMDCPTNSTIPLYLKEFARLNVTDVVRVCEPTYQKERVESRNVRVHDLPFKDGDVPPASVLRQWRELLAARVSETASRAAAGGVAAGGSGTESEGDGEPTTIAVHCVAGLGRAPVLVAVALIERGMDPLDAIEHVRHKRRGAFNNRQIMYLAETYKRSSAGFKAASKIGLSIRSTPISSVSPAPSHSDDAAAPAAATAATTTAGNNNNTAAATTTTTTTAGAAEHAKATADADLALMGVHKSSFFRKIFGMF